MGWLRMNDIREFNLPKTHLVGPQISMEDTSAFGEIDRLNRKVESLQGLLSRLSEASVRINDSLEIEVVLQAVIDGCRSLTNARYGAILTFDESGEIEILRTSGISPEERERIAASPRGLGILGYMNEVEGALRIGDIARHPESVGFPKNHPPMKSFLGFSMRHQGKHLGNIYLTEKEGGGEFTLQDENILTMFASQGAAAITNGHTYRMENRTRADLEAVLDITPVAVMVFDAQSLDLIAYNPEARRIFHRWEMAEVDRNELRKMLIFRRPNGQEIPPDQLPTQKVIRSGQTVRAEEIVIWLPTGKSVPTLCSAAPIRAENGEIVSVVSVLQDMTPLDEVERRRNEFTSIVSREILDPLTSIKGATATLMGSSPIDSESARPLLRIIDHHVVRIGDLVTSLQDLNLIEAGQLSVDTKPLDLSSLIKEATQEFLGNGGRRTVAVDVAQPMPLVLAERRRIVKILTILLTNAAAHSPDWSSITVSASPQDLSVEVSVTDQGVGIDPEQVPYAFRKYHRIETGHLESGDFREGLGLAICRGIIEAHGGRIWVGSDGPGLGSRFTFTLPVASEGDLHVTPESTMRAADPHTGVSSQAPVLMVVHEPSALRLMRNSLLESGYTPVVVGSPDEAVLLARSEQPAMILLDFKSSVANGVELIERIKEVADAPVIVLLDHEEEDFIPEIMEAGAEDYILKPLPADRLTARIRAFLSKWASPVRARGEKHFVLGDLAIDYLEHSVTLAGHPVQLTPTEYKLLYELSINAGSVLTYDRLLSRIWSDDHSGDTQVVRTFVKNLRRKLGDNPTNPAYISTVPRTGYRMLKPWNQGSRAVRT